MAASSDGILLEPLDASAKSASSLQKLQQNHQ
ncbi:MAG: hypothetical protein ACJAVI_001978 [Candidatus Azotimanducaceae bacterium]|jgi:hypothetical protein